jgi:histidyl-tRNA synthetase
MKYLPPKGTQDIWDKKFYSYDNIAKTITKVTEQYGFRQIRTPGFEPIEILAKNAGAEVTSQIYTFEDKGGRPFGIKSDITPAVARFIVGNGKSIPKPIKISCYDRVYRYERPQSGRNREITQINAELFGIKSGLVDAELLACFLQCYTNLGLSSVNIEIGYRPFLEEYIRIAGFKEDQILPVIRLIDKKEKIGDECFVEEIVACGANQTMVENIKQLTNIRGNLKPTVNKMKILAGNNAKLQYYANQLEELTKNLKLYSVDKNFRINLGLARGSDYYTGIIFEAKIPNSSYGSIGGGGRYDNLVTEYGGNNTPAVGFSIGVDRIYLVLEELKIDNTQNYPTVDYYLVSESDSATMSNMISYAQKLRAKGKNVEINLLGVNLSEQLQTAKLMNSRKVAIFKKVNNKENKAILINLNENSEQIIDTTVEPTQ